MSPAWKDRIAHALALWFGCGLVPIAPGTAGTLGALPLYLALRPLGAPAVLLAAAALTIVGIWAAERVIARTGDPDPQRVVIDEVAGVLITWSVASGSAARIAIGFVLFRLFDQLKPWPARLAERRLPGGYGVVLDDVAAGVWGAAVLAAIVRLGWVPT